MEKCKHLVEMEERMTKLEDSITQQVKEKQRLQETAYKLRKRNLELQEEILNYQLAMGLITKQEKQLKLKIMKTTS